MWRSDILIYPSRSGSRRYDHHHSCGTAPCECIHSRLQPFYGYESTKPRSHSRYDSFFHDYDFLPNPYQSVFTRRFPYDYQATEPYHSLDRHRPRKHSPRGYESVYYDDVGDANHTCDNKVYFNPQDHNFGPERERPAYKRPECNSSLGSGRLRQTASQRNQYFRDLLKEAQDQKYSNTTEPSRRNQGMSAQALMSGARSPRDWLSDRERRDAGLVRDDSGNWFPMDGNRGRGIPRHRGGLCDFFDDSCSVGKRDWYRRRRSGGFIEELED